MTSSCPEPAALVECHLILWFWACSMRKASGFWLLAMRCRRIETIENVLICNKRCLHYNMTHTRNLHSIQHQPLLCNHSRSSKPAQVYNACGQSAASGSSWARSLARNSPTDDARTPGRGLTAPGVLTELPGPVPLLAASALLPAAPLGTCDGPDGSCSSAAIWSRPPLLLLWGCAGPPWLLSKPEPCPLPHRDTAAPAARKSPFSSRLHCSSWSQNAWTQHFCTCLRSCADRTRSCGGASLTCCMRGGRWRSLPLRRQLSAAPSQLLCHAHPGAHRGDHSAACAQD
jgi:hypothetical protein